MAAGNNGEQNFRQNLTDAGCDGKTTQQCLCFFREGKFTEAVQALAAHRAELLEAVHSSQEKIDCLDYLLYQIKKELGKKE